jgi:hypothetical protein
VLASVLKSRLLVDLHKGTLPGNNRNCFGVKRRQAAGGLVGASTHWVTETRRVGARILLAKSGMVGVRMAAWLKDCREVHNKAHISSSFRSE